MTSLYVIVHYDGSMKEWLIERCTFGSMTPKVVAIKRGMTLQSMKEVIIGKLHREVEETIATIHFR